MFRKEDRGRVADGTITVTYRLWERSHVRAGKRYETGFGAVEVEDVQVVPAGMVPASDMRPTGCESIAAIRALAGEHKGADVTDETLLHRVRFRVITKAERRRG
jgi:hypothetical protein